MPASDKSLPENSKANLDKRLDLAVKETFPTSDPVSVGVTRGGAINDDNPGLPSAGEADHLISEAKAKLSVASDAVLEAAQQAAGEGGRYVRETLDQFPEAERYYRQGTHALRQQVTEHPLITFLLGIGVGYAAAWMIHAVEWGRTEGVPDYARTRQVYARDRNY